MIRTSKLQDANVSPKSPLNIQWSNHSCHRSNSFPDHEWSGSMSAASEQSIVGERINDKIEKVGPNFQETEQ